MRLHRNQRLQRLLQRLPRRHPLTWLEALLCVVLGLQLARLIWVAVTPQANLGAWTPVVPTTLPPSARTALFASFDPFFRAAADADVRQAATGLPLKLFGTRSNLASGGGSAIIATPDGLQSSYAVGDKVVEGVVLKQVADDHVVLDRGGTSEVLYLDQSVPAPVVGPAPAGPAAVGTLPLTPPPTVVAPATPTAEANVSAAQ